MTFAANIPLRRAEAKILRRSELTRRLVTQLHHDEAVIGGIGFANFELWGAGQRPQNFYMLGSMGLAIPIALAKLKPRTLIVVIQDNGTYQITGGQKAASDTADLIGIARESGLPNSAWAADDADFETMTAQALHQDGPWIIGCRIDTDKPQSTTERDPTRIRDQFMRGLGVTR